jgi:hypothetical protein
MSTGIVFASFKKISFANTKPKEVPFETTGGESED